MNTESGEDLVLPFTPTNTGRRSRIGYLGIAGENFNDLWPLFAGAACSVALGIVVAAGEFESGGGLAFRLAFSASPTVVAYGYLRMFVHERPPHFRNDLWSDVLSLRADFAHPPFPRLPLLPRVSVRIPSGDPSPNIDHPLLSHEHER